MPCSICISGLALSKESLGALPKKDEQKQVTSPQASTVTDRTLLMMPRSSKVMGWSGACRQTLSIMTVFFFVFAATREEQESSPRTHVREGQQGLESRSETAVRQTEQGEGKAYICIGSHQVGALWTKPRASRRGPV